MKMSEHQATAVIMLTLLNVAALVHRDLATPWWVWVIAIATYPAIAFVANLSRPALRNEPHAVFRVTDGVQCFSCEAYRDHFVLRPENGDPPWETGELSIHGLRKC